MYTFEYNTQGRAIGYVDGCIGEHNQYCEQVAQHMIDWQNSLPSVSRVRVAKRNNMLTGTTEAPVQRIATS